jgi:hypothetical protein
LLGLAWRVRPDLMSGFGECSRRFPLMEMTRLTHLGLPGANLLCCTTQLLLW